MSKKLKCILLIDDNPDDNFYHERVINKCNAAENVLAKTSGMEALDFLKSKSDADSPPELILLDINMPKMNGIEFLTELRADPQLKQTPVVILTTSSEDRDRVDAYNLNVAGYLLKPITFSTFVETMVALNQYWALCEMP